MRKTENVAALDAKYRVVWEEVRLTGGRKADQGDVVLGHDLGDPGYLLEKGAIEEAKESAKLFRRAEDGTAGAIDDQVQAGIAEAVENATKESKAAIEALKRENAALQKENAELKKAAEDKKGATKPPGN